MLIAKQVKIHPNWGVAPQCKDTQNHTMQTQSTICTVFEGHYHKGVAGLANSLCVNGFEGIIWAGYKGNLPPWATIKSNINGVEQMTVTETLSIYFVKLAADTFLPYCKPDFMLDILENKMPEVERLFFFDCDIIVKCRFSYFEEWADFGIALCEDVNSPMPTTHPLRGQWKKYFEKYGIEIKSKDSHYINGGFVGLRKEAKNFLKTWKMVQNLMMEEIKVVTNINFKDRTNPFNCTDQDALNIAKDLTSETLSIADANAMDLRNYGYIMSHAVGQQKPWQKNWLKFIVRHGQRPTMTDRLFMQHTKTPLSIFTPQQRWARLFNMKLAIVLARVIG
jgi:hypothetical protein